MKLFSIGIILLMIFNACTYNTYIQNRVNVPFIEEENQAQVNGMVTTQKMNVSGSYALNDKYFITAAGYWRFLDHWLESGYHEGILAEAGFGYYRNFNSQYIELQGGFGYAINQANMSRGLGSMSFEGEDVAYIANYGKAFGQVFYGKSFKEGKVGIGLRTNLVYYPVYDYDIFSDFYYESDYEILADDEFRQKNVVGLILDPFIHVEGNKRLRLMADIGYSFDFFNKLDSYKPEFPGRYKYQWNSENTHPKYNRIMFKLGVKFVFGGEKSTL